MESRGVGENTDLRVEAKLRHEVELARVEYESAMKRSRSLMEQAEDVQMEPAADVLLVHPDGTTALRQAIALQQRATSRYSNALKTLSEFVLGKVPELSKITRNISGDSKGDLK